MKNALISIVIPTLNEEKFLPKLLQSLAEQSLKNFEVIVVDGKSQDKTVDVARSFEGKILHLSVIESDRRGVSYQKNLGAQKAKEEWVVFVDADVILYPYAIERLQVFLCDSKREFITPWFSPDTTDTADVAVSLLGLGMFEGALMVKKPLAACVVAVKKELFDHVGGFDTTRTFGEDYDLTQKLEKIGVPLYIIRETLYIQSFRRYRAQGRMKFLQAYAKGILSVMLTSQSPKKIDGYELGGQIYRQKKKSPTSLLKEFQKGLKKLMREMVG
ncbi:glycosyltransferase [Candidatus Gottesmanbacteria bacterium]|nr:glycosyltransferase [Candidatus Gottesmanbacteria bacterium]